MIDPDTGCYTVGELEAAAAAAKQRVKDAKKAEAAKAKEDAKARLTAFEDARAKVNEKAKAFAKSGGKGAVETTELADAILDLDNAASVLSGKAAE